MLIKKKWQTKCLTLCLAVLLLAAMLPVSVFAADSGEITGKFGIGSAPEVESIQIFEDDGVSVPESLTPQQDYIIKITVNHADTLAELNNIYAYLWYDAEGDDTTYEAAYTSPEYIFFEWNQALGGNFSAVRQDALNQQTWVLDTDNCSQPADLGLTSGTFVYKFKIGKVATQTLVPAKWQVGAYVADKDEEEDSMIYDETGVYGLPMDWYGETLVPAAYEVEWDNAFAGMNFDDNKAGEQVFKVDNEITFISNGTFAEQVKAASSWTGTDASTAALIDNIGKDDSLTSGQKEFALKIGLDATFIDTFDSVNDDPFTEIRNTNDQTLEEGTEISDYFMFLKLSDDFVAGPTYSGSITFGITNAIV